MTEKECTHEFSSPDYEYDLYICDNCDEVVEGSPGQDRDEVRAEMQMENFA